MRDSSLKVFSHPSNLTPQIFRGFTLIEVLIATAIATVLFFGFFEAYAVAANVIWNSKARMGGTTLAASQIERVRALPYASVDTLPEEVKTLNGISYTIRTIVVSVDDVANGAGNDYKSLKVEAGWIFRDSPQSVVLITYVAP